MVLGRQEFSERLVTFVKQLSPEDKAKIREALYEWLKKRNERN